MGLIVIDRRTWDSLPAKVRPLPGRRNARTEPPELYGQQEARLSVLEAPTSRNVGDRRRTSLLAAVRSSVRLPSPGIRSAAQAGDALAPAGRDMAGRDGGVALQPVRLRYRLYSHHRFSSSPSPAGGWYPLHRRGALMAPLTACGRRRRRRRRRARSD